MTKKLSLYGVGVVLIAALITGCSLNNAVGGTESMTISGAPSVRLVSPQPNAAYLEGVAVNIQALITNAGADIDRVEVAVDNQIAAALPDPNTSDAASFSIAHTWTAAGVGTHTISVTAFRADGSSSDPVSANINVVAQGAAAQPTTVVNVQPTSVSNNPAPTATVEDAPAMTRAIAQGGQTITTNTPRPTTAAVNSAPTATTTPNVPMASFAQAINVRRGPGTNFEPVIGVVQPGQNIEIIGINPARSWYKIRFGTPGEGWVFAQLTTVTGDTTNLPVDVGPATPIPPTPVPVLPSAIPATAAPQSSADLVVGILELIPGQPRCGETFSIGLDVANLGTTPTSASSTVDVIDYRAADNSQQGNTVGGFPVLQPNQTFRVIMQLTISTHYAENHRLVLTVDPQNVVPETDNSNNVRDVTYLLERGNCP